MYSGLSTWKWSWAPHWTLERQGFYFLLHTSHMAQQDRRGQIDSSTPFSLVRRTLSPEKLRDLCEAGELLCLVPWAEGDFREHPHHIPVAITTGKGPMQEAQGHFRSALKVVLS